MMAALCTWLEAHGSSCLELVGFAFGIAYVVLIIRQRAAAWPVGVVNAAVYTVIFARAGLYSDTGLQVVYIALSLYGWYHWLRGGEGAGPLRVQRVAAAEAIALALGAVVTWAALAFVTARIPGNRIPYLDAVPVTLSLAAQWMTTRKHLENWWVWIVANVLYVGIFASRGLYLTTVLYAVFLVLAVRGYVEWKRSLSRDPSASS